MRFLTLFFIFLIVGYNPWISRGEELIPGDLIFQMEGNSEFSRAISESTAAKDSIKIVHVGIVDTLDGGEAWVIEASPEEGVREIPLYKFLEESPKIEGQPGIVVKRLNFGFPNEKVIKKAKSHIGELYDWWYLPDNGKIYCSELVQVSYIDNEGKYIFQPTPMNFKDSEGNLPSFWVELFNQLEMEVPQGIPGTNPQDIFHHPALKEIDINF